MLVLGDRVGTRGWRLRNGGSDVMVREKVGEVGGDLGMEGVVSEEKAFELNLLWEKEPVDRSDVAMVAGASKQ